MAPLGFFDPAGFSKVGDKVPGNLGTGGRWFLGELNSQPLLQTVERYLYLYPYV